MDKWYHLPKGHRIDSGLPKSQVTQKLPYRGNKQDDRMCVLDNLINLLQVFGDYPLVQELSAFTDFEAWSKYCGTKNNVREAMHMLTKKSYNVRLIDIDDIYDYSFHEMHLCILTQMHCVGIWNNEIYDASHTNVLELTRTNLNWCCGDFGPFQNCTIKAYKFAPSKRRKKEIERQLKFA